MTTENHKKLLEAGFDKCQIDELREGWEAGVDVTLYANKELYALQMRQVRIGLMEKLPVQTYADISYDWFQMEEIRKGLKAGLDISVYAHPEIPYDKMRQVRKGLKEGINLAPYVQLKAGILRELRKALVSGINLVGYIKEGYGAEQLHQIRLALEKGLDITPYLTKEFRGVSIAEICRGLESGLDVSVYAKMEYSWQQMREIRLGLENRVDITVYVSPLYNWQQMREIRLGMESGLDVASYRSLMYTAAEMQKKRMRLQENLRKVTAFMDQMESGGERRPDEAYAVEKADTGKEALTDEALSVVISPDEMEAYIRIGAGGRPLKENILRALKEEGVVSGIDEEAVERLLTEGGNTEMPVARGALPKNGTDGYYEYFFRTELNRAPKVLPDGSVDYQNIEWFEMVEQGQKLACYHNAEGGVSGYTVTGKAIPARNGVQKSVLSGRGFMLMPDQRTYISTMNGKIELKGSRMEISPLLIVSEATLATGNIDFEGSVRIMGHVGGGIVVKATEDVVVDGYVEAAVIECGGSVILRQGANGSGSGFIRARKNVTGKFFEAVSVYAGEDIQANYCLNCDLYAEGRIIVNGVKGTLAGGSAYARKALKAYNVGNQVGIVTYIKLGISGSILKQQKKTAEKIKEVNKELSILGNAYVDFQRKYPPEVRNTMEMYLKIENAIYTKEKQLEKLYTGQKQLEEMIGETGEAFATIKGNLFEGVMIEINSQKWAAQMTRNVTVKNINNRISVYGN